MEQVNGKVKEQSKVRLLVIMAMLVAVCGVCAQVSIPMPIGVPFTLQTLAVMIIALILPPKWAGVTLLVYLGAGCVGLPVFAQAKAGIGAFFGPTGGFLWGFLPAAICISYLAKAATLTWKRGILACVSGMVITYGLGVVQLSFVSQISLGQAFVVGALPYLPLEVVKVVLAIKIGQIARKRNLIHF